MGHVWGTKRARTGLRPWSERFDRGSHNPLVAGSSPARPTTGQSTYRLVRARIRAGYRPDQETTNDRSRPPNTARLGTRGARVGHGRGTNPDAPTRRTGTDGHSLSDPCANVRDVDGETHTERSQRRRVPMRDERSPVNDELVTARRMMRAMLADVRRRFISGHPLDPIGQLLALDVARFSRPTRPEILRRSLLDALSVTETLSNPPAGDSLPTSVAWLCEPPDPPDAATDPGHGSPVSSHAPPAHGRVALPVRLV